MVVRRHTFLFADLVSFTRFTARYGDERAADVAVGFQERVRALASRLGCETVGTQGDAVLVRSDDAESALALGSAILRLSAAGALPQVRVGLDTGGAARRGGDWFGAAVNTAARVTSAAAAGELLVSERVRDACLGTHRVTMRRRARVPLKGLAPQTLYATADTRATKSPRDSRPRLCAG
jgi:adenylate cyclase